MRFDLATCAVFAATALRSCLLTEPPPPLVIDCVTIPQSELRYPDQCTDAGPDDAAAPDAGDAGP